jgi:predicted ArsR family transcriptional regulator
MGPRATVAGEGRAGLSPQRALVWDELRRNAPLTVGAIATATGLHENTVREHLEGLGHVHLINRTQAPAAGRGRPAWLYSARAAQQSIVARDNVALATVLAGQIARSSATPGADATAAGREWGRALSADWPAERTAAGARRRVTALLDDLGFAPRPDRHHQRLRLESCPMLDAARQYPQVVCAVHAGLVAAALTALGDAADAGQVELQPFATPGACLLHLGSAERRPA